MSESRQAQSFRLEDALHEMSGAIFDVDGTLLDSMKIWGKLGGRCLEQFGVNLDLNARVELANILTPMGIDEACVYLYRRYGLGVVNGRTVTPGDLVAASLSLLENFYKHEVRLKHGAKEFLTWLQELQIPMIIVTSGDYTLVEQALSREGVLDCFIEILTCSDYQTDKRTPGLFRIAAEKMGAKPQRTFVFEDALYALRSAWLGGFRTVAVEDPSNEPERSAIKATAHYYLTDFESAIDITQERSGYYANSTDNRR